MSRLVLRLSCVAGGSEYVGCIILLHSSNATINTIVDADPSVVAKLLVFKHGQYTMLLRVVSYVVLFFLQAEWSSAAEIHRQISAVYGEHCMSDSTVGKWNRKLAETDVIEEGGQGRKSVATANLVDRVDQVIKEKWRLRISELSIELQLLYFVYTIV